MKKNLSFYIGLLIAITLLWPLFYAPYFSHHDDVQIIRLFEMVKCIKDLQIPCRWVPDLGGVYGYPLFNYYGPLPYYFGAVIYFISGSLIFSAKTMFATPFLLSYIFMYLFAKRFWGKLGGSLAAIFFTLAPYHAVDFYVRGAMGELWGLMFFPGLLWSLFRLYDRPKISNFLIFAANFAGIFSSHNLSAMMFLPIVFGLIIILFLQKKEKKFLWFSLASFILGLGLAAFYFLPMYFEKNLVYIESTTWGYFSYTEHFKGLRRLFLSRDWGYGSSLREIPAGPKDDLSYQIGIIHWAVWLLVLLILIKFRKNIPNKSIFIFLNIVTLAAIFMIHPRSEFIWKAIEPLKFLQFPWRFLAVVITIISFLSGAVITLVKNERRQFIIWGVLVFLAIVFNFSYFKPKEFLYLSDKDYLSGSNWDKQIKRSIFDYLPKSAKEPPADLATQRYEVVTGSAKVTDLKEGTNWVSFNVQTLGHTILMLSQYYFPNWVILVNGAPINVEYNNNHLGLMNFILDKGSYRIEARLHDTPIRTLGNILTLFSANSFLILMLFQINAFKKIYRYYLKAIS